MGFFTIIEKWFWAFGIVAVFFNAAVYRQQAAKRIKENPQLEAGYKKIIRGFLFLTILPWVVMGVGLTAGEVPGIKSYFHPREGNPFVVAFYLSLFLIWGIITFWIFLSGGAEKLIKHPGLFDLNFKKPWMIKLLWLAGLACSIFVVFTLYTGFQ